MGEKTNTKNPPTITENHVDANLERGKEIHFASMQHQSNIIS